MAKNGRYGEKTSPLLNVLYVIVLLGLIVALVFMYKINRDRQQEYKQMVRTAAQDEAAYDIESRKVGLEVQVETETAEPELTAAPTEVPEVTSEPDQQVEVPEEPASEPQPAQDANDPLVDDSLATGIDG